AEAGFHIADSVITEVADQAARETLVPLQWRNPVALLELVDENEGIVPCHFLHDNPVRLHSDVVADHTQHSPARQADNRIASPLFSALDRFEEIGMQTTTKL